MAVDLEKVKAWLRMTQEHGLYAGDVRDLEALVTEVERLRAQVTNHEWVIEDMGRELRRSEGVRGGMR